MLYDCLNHYKDVCNQMMRVLYGLVGTKRASGIDRVFGEVLYNTPFLSDIHVQGFSGYQPRP